MLYLKFLNFEKNFRPETDIFCILLIKIRKFLNLILVIPFERLRKQQRLQK